jgi:hypothetical protein
LGILSKQGSTVPGAETVRDRLEKALLRASRGTRTRPGRRSSSRWNRIATGEGAVQAGPALPSAPPLPPSSHSAAQTGGAPDDEPLNAELPTELPTELMGELLERLDRIEQRLGDLHRPVRPIPPSRELFAEWVRLRHWEEIPFGDFLKLRRAGLV